MSHVDLPVSKACKGCILFLSQGIFSFSCEEHLHGFLFFVCLYNFIKLTD